MPAERVGSRVEEARVGEGALVEHHPNGITSISLAFEAEEGAEEKLKTDVRALIRDNEDESTTQTS